MSNRIFYAVQTVDIAGVNTGFQTVSVNASVDFEQVFELGCLEVYENLEGVPNVEISAERAFPATGSTLYGSFGGTASSESEAVAAVAVFRPNVNMQVADDNTTPYDSLPFVKATGCYVSSWSCNFPVDGFATENCTVVGNALKLNEGAGREVGETCNDTCTSGLVVRRQDVTGYGGRRLQNVSYSIDIGREDLFELSSKSPYFRAATFPIEVTTDWEFLATIAMESDALNFTAAQNSDVTSCTSKPFFSGLVSVGDKARLTSTNYSGGDAGGGNATVAYSYVTYNQLKTSR